MQVHGTAVRTLREHSGWRLADLAVRAHISVPHLSAIERGTRGAHPATIHRLAVALNVPTDVIARLAGVVSAPVIVQLAGLADVPLL